jgi:hypothetical protein
MSKRKEAEAFILKYLTKIAPKSGNDTIYKNLFSKMNDKEFDTFMSDLESGKKYLVFQLPNFKDTGVSTENNLAIAEELGHNFFQRLWVTGKKDTSDHLIPIENLILDLPVRRASQLLIKKISVPDDNRTIDAFTGQPTGESKGAKISYTELQVCAAMGLDNSMIELMKYRGGDNKGQIAFNTMLSRYGRVNLKAVEPYASGVESTKTLKTFLTSMMLKTTL